MHILRRIASTTAILSCIFLVFLYVLGGVSECVFFVFLFVVVIVVVFLCCCYCFLLLFWGCFGGRGLRGEGGVTFTVSSIKAVHDL